MEEELLSKISEFIHGLNIANIIMTVTSMVLSVLSIALSIAFYWFGYKANKENAELTSIIKNKTESLNYLFDKMYSSSFKLIETQSTAMQKKLFESIGTVENSDLLNYDLEVLTFIINTKGRCTIQSISEHFINLTEERIKSIVHKIEERGTVKLIGNEIFLANNSSQQDQSEKMNAVQLEA